MEVRQNRPAGRRGLFCGPRLLNAGQSEGPRSLILRHSSARPRAWSADRAGRSYNTWEGAPPRSRRWRQPGPHTQSLNPTRHPNELWRCRTDFFPLENRTPNHAFVFPCKQEKRQPTASINSPLGGLVLCRAANLDRRRQKPLGPHPGVSEGARWQWRRPDSRGPGPFPPEHRIDGSRPPRRRRGSTPAKQCGDRWRQTNTSRARRRRSNVP